MLNEIKESFEYLDEFQTEVVISTEHFEWLIEQVELLQKVKEKVEKIRGEFLYAPKLSDEQIKKFKEEWAKSEPGKITIEK